MEQRALDVAIADLLNAGVRVYHLLSKRDPMVAHGVLVAVYNALPFQSRARSEGNLRLVAGLLKEVE